MAITPTQQIILEIEFADSESDSDDEIVEKNPPQHVPEEPPKKRRKTMDLVHIGSVLTAAGLGSSNRHIAKQMGVGSRLFEGFESDLWSAETA